ncbi:MAG: hydantoinase B/oxoprolinase family protein [Anaerolineales bacterium]
MMDGIELEIFKGLLSAIPEEMGVALRRSSFSANIKERLDFSCALFDREAQMIAQAAHIPVHLGAMPLSVQACMDELELEPGDVAILNDPFRGGTHLPDITLVSPIFLGGELFGFTANRAHHADVGGITPGSMPISTDVYQEGLLIPPSKLVVGGELNEELWARIMAEVRTPDERSGDLRAQLAANHIGILRALELMKKYDPDLVRTATAALLEYSERLTRELLIDLPAGTYHFSDQMDDDGISPESAVIEVAITIENGNAVVDFAGTSRQRQGSINAVRAIAVSAVYYVFRCLLRSEVPNNSGSMRPIKVLTPEGSLVNAIPPASVAGGNVETSQRIVDVLLGALAQVLPDRIPAASQGTMNNLTIGGRDPVRDRPFAYYETIAGGAGASPQRPGANAIHTHMTNTLNTPIEAIEYEYPLRVTRYAVRANSGGEGKFAGGDGIVREIELLSQAEVTILSDRRRFPPYGLAEGKDGQVGRNTLAREDSEEEVPGKISQQMKQGERIRIETPGGGGHGEA